MTDSIEQQQISSDLIKELIKEKRSVKRWKNFRFLVVVFVVLFILMMVVMNRGPVSLGPSLGTGYVAFIRWDGTIEAGRDFSAERVLPELQDAFADSKAEGIVIDINSGGGSPVQASIIHDAIQNFKRKYHKKVIVVGEDMLASGAYYIAVAADKIYVNPNSITGSIGVIMKSFGFPGLIKKIGIERRVYTAGVNKDRLDPFLPQNTQDVEKIRTVIDEIYKNFKEVVLEGRKGKLKGDPEELFTGDFWSGETALHLGLVDELGNLMDVLHKEFRVSQYKDYSSTQKSLKSFMGQLGSELNSVLKNEEVAVLEKV